jgi:antitoxin VapB
LLLKCGALGKDKEMAIQINNPEVEELAQELIKYTGESVQQAVANALRERLDRVQAKHDPAEALAQELLQIGRDCATLPVLDDRTPEAILGYTADGLPS